MRLDLRLEKTVLVALTGYGQEEYRKLAQEAGFDAHLVKPVDFNDLSEILNIRKMVSMK